MMTDTKLESKHSFQPLHSKVLTPKGYVDMKDLKEEDLICGTDPCYQKVTSITPIGYKEVYSVKFYDGSTVECDIDHLWEVNTFDGKQILSVKDMLRSGLKYNTIDDDIMYKYYVSNTIVKHIHIHSPVDPYLLGFILDGAYYNLDTGDIEVLVNHKYVEQVEYLANIPDNNYVRRSMIGVSPNKKSLPEYETIIMHVDTESDIRRNGILLNPNRSIPESYIYDTYNIRKSLFDGLIDSNEASSGRFEDEFSFFTEYKQLAHDFKRLCSSLGYLTVITETVKTHRRNRNPFTTNGIPKTYYNVHTYSHRSNLGNPIVDIKATGKHAPMQSITVSNDDNLYITNDYILTYSY